jgi:OmpA-OmpF porin, OOP family
MKQGKKILIPAIALASSLMAAAANAQESSASTDTGLYVGANYGLFKSRGDDFEDENDYFEALIGYRFNSFFGLEANYANFGEFGGDFASAEVDGWGAAVVGFIPVSESFTIYAKAGQFFSTVDVEVAGFQDDFDDEQIFYGLGVSFAVAEPVDIAIEYNRYKVEIDDSEWPIEVDSSDTDIDTLKVGVKFTF